MQVTFLKSPDDSTKRYLMRTACAVLYTPDREHFGIVPIEAMYCGEFIYLKFNGTFLNWAIFCIKTNGINRTQNKHFSEFKAKS